MKAEGHPVFPALDHIIHNQVNGSLGKFPGHGPGREIAGRSVAIGAAQVATVAQEQDHRVVGRAAPLIFDRRPQFRREKIEPVQELQVRIAELLRDLRPALFGQGVDRGGIGDESRAFERRVNQVFSFIQGDGEHLFRQERDCYAATAGSNPA